MLNPDCKVGHIETKSIMTKSNGPLGGYAVNLYVGCTHGCKYCYASFMKPFRNNQSVADTSITTYLSSVLS